MAINPTTVLEAIKSPSPSIAFLYMDSETKAAAILAILVTDLVKFLNVGKSMNDVQVAATIKMILEDRVLRSLKPDDFKLCFNRIKSGFYGKSYDRMDGQIILEALHLYSAERLDECENLSIKQHKEHQDDRSIPADPEGQKKVIEILKSNLSESPIVANVEKKSTRKPIEKTARDRYIQKCFEEFYKIWLSKPYKPEKKPPSDAPGLIDMEPGGKFILYDGKPIDEVEYVQIKIREYDLHPNQ